MNRWQLKLAMTVGVLAVAACASPTAQHPIDDATLTTRVKSALIANPVAHAHEIDVETYRGVVRLRGFVDTSNERDAAETAARSVAGVKSVRNDIGLRSG